MRIQDLILPEDKVFFTLFKDLTSMVKEAAGLLKDMTSDLSSAYQKCHAIRQIEHNADGVTRQIFERLDESLITPLEPDEIARLAPALDDVIDRIDWVSHQLCSYGISETNEVLKEFSKLIIQSADEIDKGVSRLSNLKQPIEIQKEGIEVNRFWNHSRDLLSNAILDLFKTKDPIQIIKFKDIYENLEEVLAKCNDVGHVLTDISMRHV